MITKSEYIRLYCDENMYKQTGVIALSAEKLGERMDIDPIKTIRDLDDYGFSDAMRDTPLGRIEKVSVLNTRSGRMRDIPVDSGYKGIAPELDMLNKLLSFDPDNFDWGNEDTIRVKTDSNN